MEDTDCKVLMDDGVHGNPDHKGILSGFRQDAGRAPNVVEAQEVVSCLPPLLWWCRL